MSKLFFLVIRRFLHFINPHPPVGGLEISGNLLQFIIVKGGEAQTSSVRLPAGAIENGKVKDAGLLKAAATELHRQITTGSRKAYVVLTIPEHSIYTQAFPLPKASAERLEEAVSLNLQMASPLEYSQVYADWEKIKEEPDGQTEILSAFAPRSVVDDFIRVLEESHFVVVAVESSGLALARLFRADLSTKDLSVILTRLTSDGLAFFIIRRGYLYFSRFSPWQETQITLRVLEEALSRETQRVINFLRSHWPGNLDAIYYLAPTVVLGAAMEKALQGQASAIRSMTDFLKSAGPAVGLSSINEELAVATSSALRGRMPRFADTMISLASPGTEEEYRRQELLNFVRVWRTMGLAILIFFLGAFVAADFFFMNLEDSIKSQESALGSPAEAKEFEAVRIIQNRLNRVVASVRKAKEERKTPVPFIEKLYNLAQSSGIFIDRIFIQGETLPVVVNARAPDEMSAVSFKERLSNDPAFGSIDLPLSTISKNSDNMLVFVMTIRPSASVFSRSSTSTISSATAATTSSMMATSSSAVATSTGATSSSKSTR